MRKTCYAPKKTRIIQKKKKEKTYTLKTLEIKTNRNSKILMEPCKSSPCLTRPPDLLLVTYVSK